jgi:hypothetical protein
MLTGSARIVDHNTFAEMQWRKESRPRSSKMAQGFERISHMLDGDFVEILQDIYALQLTRTSPSFACNDAVALLHVDNQQASIQSRLHLMLVRMPALSPFYGCLCLAIYLSACMLCCKVWLTSIIPVSAHCMVRGRDKGEIRADICRTLFSHRYPQGY